MAYFLQVRSVSVATYNTVADFHIPPNTYNYVDEEDMLKKNGILSARR